MSKKLGVAFLNVLSIEGLTLFKLEACFGDMNPVLGTYTSSDPIQIPQNGILSWSTLFAYSHFYTKYNKNKLFILNP